MTTLPPHLEALEDELGRAASRRVRSLRRRRRVAQLATVTVAGLGLTAGALAATGDLGRWLSSADDPGQAGFLIDRARTYDGPTPALVSCAPDGSSIACEVAGADALRGRTFALAMTVDRPPSLAADDLRRLLGEARERGGAEPALLDRIERNLDTVPDEFFVNLQVLAQLGSFAIGVSDGTGALVPPPGVPMVVVCDEALGSALGCRDLRGARGVPAGAPIYVQERTADWLPAPPPASDGPVDVGAIVDEVWGRPLRADELQLLIDLSTPVVVETSTSTSVGPAVEVAPDR